MQLLVTALRKPDEHGLADRISNFRAQAHAKPALARHSSGRPRKLDARLAEAAELLETCHEAPQLPGAVVCDHDLQQQQGALQSLN